MTAALVGANGSPRRSIVSPGPNPLIVFGVNTWRRFSAPSENEIDIGVDVDPQNHNGVDYIVVGADHGAITAGSDDGIFETFVFSTRSSGFSQPVPFVFALPEGEATDGSTYHLYALASQLCRTGEPCLDAHTSPVFSYNAVSFDRLDGSQDNVDNNNDGILDTALYNPFHPAMDQVGNGNFVAPGASDVQTLTVNSEYVSTPFLGLMSIHTDNQSGPDEASLVKLKVPSFGH